MSFFSLQSRGLKTSFRCFSGKAKNTSNKAAPVALKIDPDCQTLLSRHSNQVQGLADFSQCFMKGTLGKGPSKSVLQRCEMFHTDSVLCGLSALALQCNAPTVLRHEALDYPDSENGVQIFGSEKIKVKSEKAIVANCCAVREWDSNGTVFGYNASLGPEFQAGEFGHNDYYPVIIAACQMKELDGATALRAMVLHDEIRGRLAETFSLKSYKIDHVVHGAIATAVVYGTLLGASIEEIESAVGMTVAHYIPFRAIRAGHQLSDSKGASAAISSEVAALSVHRAMRGFVGPQDIIRNPQAIFRLFKPTQGDNEAPFDLVLSHSGDDFSVMGMHFKLGLYEHQSAGAIQGLLDALQQAPEIAKNVKDLKEIAIRIYEPAFGIIGDPHKRTPTTRQSADHSMVYIIASILKKAYALGPDHLKNIQKDNNQMWKDLMLLPFDYSDEALYDPITRAIMDKIVFEHGGKEYDEKYPEGIPTRLSIKTTKESYSSDLVMFPGGHARNTTADLKGILEWKWKQMAKISFGNASDKQIQTHLNKLANLTQKTASDIASIYDLPYKTRSWKQ